MVLLSYHIISVHGIHLKDPDNALKNADVLDAMAYTENLIEPG